MAFGGYTTAILTHDHGWNDLATLPVAALVGFGVGIVVGLPALRFHGVYLALTTFAVALAVPQIAKNYPNFTGGTEGLALPTHTGLWLYRTTWVDRGDHVRARLAAPARPHRACVPRRCATARSRPPRPGSASRSYKTLAFGISVGVRRRRRVALRARQQLREPGRLRADAVAVHPDRGRRGRPGLALGRPRGRVFRRAAPDRPNQQPHQFVASRYR